MKKSILLKFLYRIEALWHTLVSKDVIVIAIKGDGKKVITLGITNDEQVDSFIDNLPMQELLEKKEKETD
jgi:hypothetical protein